jgi:peroxiredoxin
MQTYLRRKAFAATSLAVLCAVPFVVALYLHYVFALSPLAIGQVMPPLFATSLDGQAFVQDTTDGRKSLVVLFAPGCSHCRRELTNLDELLPKYMGRLKILGVSLDNHESTKAMATELNLKFPVVVADREHMERSFRINILPALFCIDEYRVLKEFYSGEHSLATDEHLLEEFISSSGAN